MISYGDTEFREWANDNGFSSSDLALIRKVAKRRAFGWFILPALTLGVGSFFAAPLMFNAYRVSQWVKQGTLEPRITFTGLILYLLLFTSFFGIIPLIVWLKIKDDSNLPGSGLQKLVRKGKIGNG